VGNTDWWITQDQLARLSALVAEMSTIHRRHLELMKKRTSKTATAEELQESVRLIARFNELEKEKRALELKNPLLWENLKKSIESKE
jgi:hypothetical protein